MSDDMNDDVDLARADWSFPIAVDLDDDPRRLDNPLVKGLIVLVMMAVATTVLVTTDDDDGSIVASTAVESEPVAPEAPATSVQDVASDTASSDTAETAEADEETTPWNGAASAFGQTLTAEQLRQQSIGDKATTTTVPPTTAAPTTTAPSTTAAPTTAPSSTETTTATDGESTTTTVVDGDAGESTSSTDSTVAGDSTTTTVATDTTVAETTTTAPPETTTTVAAGDGWVDAGNGVMVPPVLLAIRWCESRDDYQAANPSSSARGAYQFLSGSWRAYGHADRYGVSTADQATRAQQDEAALLTWERDGTRPWNASRTCWSQRI